MATNQIGAAITREAALEQILSAVSPEVRVDIASTAQRSWTIGVSDYQSYLKEVLPTYTWTWPYQLHLMERLRDIENGKINKLMVFMPPRHGKTTMITLNYIPYRLERKPGTRCILGACNRRLAIKFSIRCRKRAIERGISINQDSRSSEDWETMAGGGVRAVGVGSVVAGYPGDLIIIDDAIKNRREANSAAYRDIVWSWYRDDIYTRLEPNSAIVIINTRWHEDDLCGRILKSNDGPNWEVVSLPALAEENDPLGRKVGEALCPARYDEKRLANIRTVLGRSWWALYQQRPQEQEGHSFKRSWLEDNIDEELPPGEYKFIRYWDKAGSLERGSALTAGVLLASCGGVHWIVDVEYGQWAAAERERIITETAITDSAKYGHVVVGIEQEGGSGGLESADATIDRLTAIGVECYKERPVGDKALRAEPVQTRMSEGKYRMIDAEWNERVIDAMATFPGSDLRDIVDAMSGADKYLRTFAVEWDEILQAGIDDNDADRKEFAARWL